MIYTMNNVFTKETFDRWFSSTTCADSQLNNVIKKIISRKKYQHLKKYLFFYLNVIIYIIIINI